MRGVRVDARDVVVNHVVDARQEDAPEHSGVGGGDNLHGEHVHGSADVVGGGQGNARAHQGVGNVDAALAVGGGLQSGLPHKAQHGVLVRGIPGAQHVDDTEPGVLPLDLLALAVGVDHVQARALQGVQPAAHGVLVQLPAVDGDRHGGKGVIQDLAALVLGGDAELVLEAQGHAAFGFLLAPPQREGFQLQVGIGVPGAQLALAALDVVGVAVLVLAVVERLHRGKGLFDYLVGFTIHGGFFQGDDALAGGDGVLLVDIAVDPHQQGVVRHSF